jgi:hypothetical protein
MGLASFRNLAGRARRRSALGVEFKLELALYFSRGAAAVNGAGGLPETLELR